MVLALGLISCEMLTAKVETTKTTISTTAPINAEEIITTTLGQALDKISGMLSMDIFNEIENQITATEKDLFTKKMKSRKQLNPQTTGFGDNLDNALVFYTKTILEIISIELNNHLKTLNTNDLNTNEKLKQNIKSLSKENKIKLEQAKETLKKALLAELKVTE